MNYYAVADVHGFYEELKSALDEAGYFCDPEPHKLVVCGDLFDRGPSAVAMQEFIAEELEKDNAILIRGNHEDLMEDLVDNLAHMPDLLDSHHATNGTVDSLLQLTEMPLLDVYYYPALAQGKMRHTPFFKKILPAMRNYYETENYIFVHGWIPARPIGAYYSPRSFQPLPDWRNCGEKEWREARWFNGMHAWACGVREAGKTVVCGHRSAAFGHWEFEGRKDDFTPFREEGILAIDACTVVSGRVNCVVLHENGRESRP